MSVANLGPYRTVEEDAALPTLGLALDPVTAASAIARRLPFEGAPTTVRFTRVVAYKPGRRCLIEYELELSRSATATERVSILGKIRKGRFGNSGHRQLRALWDAGFDDQSADGVSVPRPLGTVPELRMWLQQKVEGQVVTHLLTPQSGVGVASRIAAAVQKLHATPLAAERRHTMDDELRILTRCLTDTATAFPEMAHRVTRLIDAAIRVGAALPDPQWCASHRDFYSDQVITLGDRLFLIDFDLFCEADPGLDVGNFLGHVTEHALRLHGCADALARFEDELEDQFAARAGERVRWAVRVYAALTVARHVYLCTRHQDRAHLLPTLLALAQARLDRVAAAGGHT